ncbi:PH domain-containing protein [Embleya sp. NBC_00896]|uniref:PH domain-containing protein n=1 Tax=Embleya sp. NBC_00896 TaxID=2975961 RepID=UPI00386FB370|nr:PH domain-containing protein [Embleya sp. NBC_00896]
MSAGPGEPRRLHPLTPPARGWVVIAACLGVVVHNVNTGWATPSRLGIGLVVVVPIAFAYGYVSWWFTTFRIEGDDLRIDSGVMFRRTRHVRLSRLQAVDIVRPLAARLFGLAELQLQVAGGDKAEASLSFLGEADAQKLRAELLARAAGVRPDVGEAPEQALVSVPLSAVIGSVLLSVATWAAIAPSVAVVVVALVFHEIAFLLGFLPLFLAAWQFTVGRVIRNFDFTVARSPDGLRLQHGLLEQRHQTVPPGRVQAVRIVQPWPWRLRGWVRVEINVAGYGGKDVDNKETILLPVAPRAIAHGLLGQILPGVDVDAIELIPAPRRARWHDPVGWTALAYGADAEVFVARSGRFHRILDVIPHAKVQSVRRTQGPWERRLGLASVHLDSTPGPVHVKAARRDAAEAEAMVAEQAERSRIGRREAGAERWIHNGSDSSSGPASSPDGGAR